jgi:nucleoside-diphosphate-sugar epimerase
MTAERDTEPRPRVLLTGGNGFVGSRVTRRLAADGYPIRAIVRRGGVSPDLRHPGVEEIEGDFVDPTLARRTAEGCGLVIHSAATAGPDLEPVRRVNVDGTRAMLDAARAAGALRTVHISTVSVYDVADRAVINEDSQLKTEGEPYGVTKAEGDRLVLEAAAGGLPVTIFRPGAILGYHATSTWAVRVPESIRDGQMKLRADGGDTIPFVHVEDLVDAVLLALRSERAVGRVYNMTDFHKTWREYSDRVRAWFGAPPLPVIPMEEVPPGKYWTGRFDGSRVREELGYSPRRSWEEGMEEAARAWRERRESG